MSGLIKADDNAQGFSVAKFDGGSAPPPAASPAPLRREDPMAAEIARLTALIESRDADIADLHKAVKRARAEGHEAGRAEMELEFEDNRTKALEQLGQGIISAHENLSKWHERLEVLALLVARTSLEKLFDSETARKDAVADLARAQLGRIERHMLLAVEVSRCDFPDTNEVSELAGRLGMDPALIAVQDTLDAGACRMHLKLGTIDAGLDQQWGTIRALLDSLATENLPGRADNAR